MTKASIQCRANQLIREVHNVGNTADTKRLDKNRQHRNGVRHSKLKSTPPLEPSGNGDSSDEVELVDPPPKLRTEMAASPRKVKRKEGRVLEVTLPMESPEKRLRIA